jgi:nucleoid DNA-binding protein
MCFFVRSRVMTKSELISKLFEANSDLGRRSAEAIVNSFFGEIAKALVRGARISAGPGAA